jgi:hypothetical protein
MGREITISKHENSFLQKLYKVKKLIDSNTAFCKKLKNNGEVKKKFT